MNQNIYIMKKMVFYLSVMLVTLAGFSQQNVKMDKKKNGINISEIQRSEKLNQLYLESEVFNVSGTPEQIRANRLALKAAWQEVSPEVATLYNSDHTIELTYNASRNTTEAISNRPEGFPNSVQVSDGYADYIDMKTAANGDIYIAFARWNERGITIRKSTDNGNSWSTFDVVDTGVHVLKIQMELLTGVGEEYLNVYYMGTDNKLHLFTSSIGQGGSMNGIYNSLGEIKGFSTTKSLETSTGLQRVFIVYARMDDIVFVARTAPDDYGVSFIDHFDLGVTGEQVNINYGFQGSVYITYIGKNSRIIFAEVHPNNLDPGTATTYASFGDTSTMEFKNPVIAASRKALASDNAIITVSQRLKNTSDPFRRAIFRRTNNGTWTSIHESPYIQTYSLERPSVFVRNDDGNEIIRTSYLKYNMIGQAGEGEGYTQTYNGSTMETPEIFTDPQMEVLVPIIGETADGKICMAYIRDDQGIGHGVYFSSENMLSAGSQVVENLLIYPVPAQEIVTVTARRPIDRVKVSSVLGQKVMEVSNNTNEITLNISSFAKGVYFFEIHSEGKSEIRKIIKN